jgi:hypothetical protein
MSIEFALDADMGRAMQEVRDRVAAVQAASRATPRRPPSRAGTTTTPAGGQLALLSHAQPRELSILGERWSASGCSAWKAWRGSRSAA